MLHSVFVLLSCLRLAVYCISLFCYLDYFIVRGTAANQFSSNFSKNVYKWYIKTKLLEVGSLCPSQHATIHGIQHCIPYWRIWFVSLVTFRLQAHKVLPFSQIDWCCDAKSTMAKIACLWACGSHCFLSNPHSWLSDCHLDYVIETSCTYYWYAVYIMYFVLMSHVNKRHKGRESGLHVVSPHCRWKWTCHPYL